MLQQYYNNIIIVIEKFEIYYTALPIYLKILETEKLLQLWDKNILDARGTSFQRKRFEMSKCGRG